MATHRFYKGPSKPPPFHDGPETLAPAQPRIVARRFSSKPPRIVAGPRSSPRGADPLVRELASGTPLVRFTCEPGSNLLEDVQQFIAAYTKLRFRPSIAQRVSVAAYELFANALSYGSVSAEVVFEILECGDRIEVRVVNDAIPARVDMLRERVKRLEKDPEATFVDEMRRYVTGGVARAMLGLARVRHEAQMDLELEVSGTRVFVRASCQR